MQTLNLDAANGSCLTSKNRVYFEEPEKFKLLPELCPLVFPYMPSIQDEKHTTKRCGTLASTRLF